MTADLLTDSTLTEVDGGLINTLYRVTTPAGDEYALRVFVDLPDASATSRYERETSLLAALAVDLPVPRVVVTDATRARFPQPFVMYPWVNGVTLNECRRTHGTAALQSLAHELGRTLASIASSNVRLGGEQGLPRPSASDAIDRAHRLLQSASLTRERIGHEAADALRRVLDAHAVRLVELDRETTLSHGDFNGRNIIVRHDENRLRIAAVLDWESAAIGSPLWDIGSLFRYPRRYSVEFRDEFARGYADAGLSLPKNWWLLSRVLDVTRVVTVLNDERELGSVFDDCRDVIGDLV